MLSRLKHTVLTACPVVLTVLLLCACEENDLKKIQEVSSREFQVPVQRTIGVDVIYSDSAKVKAHVTSPLMLEHSEDKSPYTEMPKGIKVTFYDDSLHITSTIVADYAIRHENEKIIELDKNVVATNAKGDQFKSDQLVWNEVNRQVTSQKPVTIITTDGSIINGTSLTTNERFDPWDITQTTGDFKVKQNITP